MNTKPLEEAITDLKRLDRYERRVWSAQKRQSTILSKGSNEK